jgi:hypothetical protein
MGLYNPKPKFRSNKYAGPCTECGLTVGADMGKLVRNPATGKYNVRHLPERTITPTGPWDKWETHTVGGCPKLPWKEGMTA